MSNKTLLFADDSATMRTLMEKTFAAESINVVTVPSGEAAIAKAKEIRPTVMVVDAGMAGISGYDVCRTIRDDDDLSYTPVIILAGVSTPYDESRGREVRVTEYVKKPFDTTQFIEKINQMVDKLESEPVEEPLGGKPSTRPTPAGGVPAVSHQPSAIDRFGEPPQLRTPQQPAKAQPKPVELPTQQPTAQPISTMRAGTLAEMSQMDERGEPLSPPSREDAIDLGSRRAPESEATREEEAIEVELEEPFGDDLQPTAMPSRTETVAETAPPKAPVEERISQAAKDVAKGVEGLTAEQAEAIRALTAEVIERVVWEVVPDLAETIIKEKIEALLQE